MANIRIQKAENSIIVGGDVNGDVIHTSGGERAKLFPDDLTTLIEELTALRESMRKQSQNLEQDESIVAVGKAVEAAKKGNTSDLLGYLKTAGQWALEFATATGANIAATAIAKSLGIM